MTDTTPGPHQNSISDLVRLAHARFGNLTAAEFKLLRAASKGEFAFCGPNSDPKDPTNDPSKADTWDPDRQVRAGLLRWLCVDRQAREFVDPKGIQLLGARIHDSLDLESASVPFPLLLFHCRLVAPTILRHMEIPGLNLEGTWVHSISADGARVNGNVFLRKGFHADGEVRLLGAQIGGTLDCSGGTFKNPPQKEIEASGRALSADGAVISGSVFLRNKFTAEGKVSLPGAQIGRNLVCSGSTFKNPPQEGIDTSGYALNADRAVINGSVFFNKNKNKSFTAEGEVRLLGAQIGGTLDCSGGTFNNPPQEGIETSGDALSADRAVIKGNVFLSEGFTSEGEVRLLGAQIGGTLDCSGGTFKNPPQKGIETSGKALSADGAVISGSVFLRNKFTAEGKVSLLEAKIGGTLDCSGSTFKNPPQEGTDTSGRALSADRVLVMGSVFLRDDFTAEGQVRLLGAQIGGDLDCSGGTFKNPVQEGIETSGDALSADGAVIKGGVLLRDRFTAEGQVRLHGTQIGGDLSCVRANIVGALIAQRASIAGALFWRGLPNPSSARLDLRNATATSISDEPKSWPARGNLALEGFNYKRIAGGPTDAKSRLEWLARQHSFATQPYRQLARVLRDEGNDRGARQVLFEMERLRRKKEDGFRRAKFWSSILKITIGYGYYPVRALMWLAGLFALGFGLFWAGYRADSIVPTEKHAYSTFVQEHSLPPHYERFHASIYSLENSFPLIKLGQVEHWQPAPGARVSSTNASGWTARLNRVITPPWFLRWFRWVQVLLGWFFATMGVVGITGLARKE